jgi:hypothetical protein
MVTWRIVDDDVECLHVERNPTMACSGSQPWLVVGLTYISFIDIDA